MRTFLPSCPRALGPAAPGLVMEASGSAGGAFLNDIVAYVEVWSSKGTENYSKTFTKQLEDMGAKVSKTFNKQVTHVIFKDGYQSTWDKAQKTGVKLVSVLWVEKCRMAGARVDESLFPAVNTNENLIRRKHKCMQPKDFIPKTPENDKRLQKKFEKMAEELRKQKTSLGDGSPVLLFESPPSLARSSEFPTGSHQSTMKRRLEEMKEKRENLSPTSSQMLEQSQQNPSTTLREASLNTSHQFLNSDESFTSGSHSSFDALHGDEERKLGRSSSEMAGKACPSSPALRTSSFYSLALPNQPSSQEVPDSLSQEGTSWQKDAADVVVDAEGKPVAGVSQGKPDEKQCLSPTVSTMEEHLVRLGSKTSSAKRKRSVDLDSPPKAKLKKRCSRKPGLPIQLIKSDQSLQSSTGSVRETPDTETSSYEDYFSPVNLKERNSERLPPEAQPLASPLFHCRSLSKWERKNILEKYDLTCIGEKLRPINMADLISKRTSSPERPDKEDVSTASGCMPLVGASANDSPEHCRQPGPQLREDIGPVGSSHPAALHSPARITPLKRRSTEAREAVDVRGSPEEATVPPVSAAPEGEAHSGNLSFGEDCNVEKPVEEKKNLSTGCSESM